MNYEVDTYVEAGKRLPSKEITLHTLDAEYFFFKADILAGLVTYSTDKHMAANLVTLTTSQVFDIINMNRRGEKPERLTDNDSAQEKRPADLVEQESLTRFDKRKKSKNKKKNKGEHHESNHQQEKDVKDNGNGENKAPHHNREHRHRDHRPHGHSNHKHGKDARPHQHEEKKEHHQQG